MIVLDGRSLGVEDAAAVANRAEPVKIAATAMRRMRASREFVEAAMCCSDPVYALNTGVGLLANIRLEESEIEQMQLNLVRSHCCGAGEPMPANVVRGMMLIRANVLGKGLSGIRPVVAERICDLLNHGITPVVPSRGSVGASGDLAPLAHMALVLIGEGFAEYRGRVLPAAECLERVGLEPLTLLGKEGISLLNGTQAMLSYGCLLLARMEALFYSAQTAAAFTMEALRGTTAALDARIHAARPHPGQMLSAAHLLELLEGSGIPRSHGEGGARIQDAYCLRCIPQVHGAYWDALAEARRVFEIELNSATDNPLVFTGDDEFGGDAAIVSGGNFHGAPLALALDQLAIALYQIAGISERRCERLLNPALNEGLPAFLASKPGIESGLMMAQVTAAALVAEIRVLATPASIGSIPTSGNQEDFVSMGMTSALKLAQSVELAETVAGIELMAAVRGLDLRGDVSTAALEAARLAFREAVPAWTEDCVLSGPIGRATEFVTAGGWAADRVASIVAGPRIANDKSAMHGGTERWHEESDGGDPVTYVPVRAARGNVKTAKGWIQEAAKRMLMNNLDPEVAEKPEELIVYGGRGKAARNWECYHKIVETLDRLEDTQTLLVQSGKPVGVLDTHRLAPRVLIANSNLVPKWANWEEFDRLDAAGLMMYGQMTAGSWIYIGTQGILQGTYETFKSAAKQHFNGTLAGTITVTAGLGGMGGAQPLAVKLAGGVSICIEVDATRIKRRLATRYLDKATNSWSEALDMANAAKKDRVPLSIGLLGNAAEILPRMAAMGFVPDLVTDQTSAHDPMWGYLPPSTADEDVNLLRSSKPDEYAARVRTSMAEHVKAILAMQRAGAIAFDYGNNLRTQAKLAGVTEAMEYPGFVPAFIRDSFCEGRGPFRWVALSGDPADIAKTDAALLELFPDDERLQEWLRFASTEIAFQGLPARICWLGYRERDKAGLLFNQMVREGRLAAPIVIGRDHLDAGSVASPFRETEAMLDGSDAVSDWALLNFATGIASGAAWMSFHHGGGVGMGYSQHAGLVAVADGSDEADERLRMCLTNDPAMGVLRHADAGYEKARGVAKARGLDMPSLP